MNIEFENEEELVEAIVRSGVNVFSFTVAWMYRFGLTLNPRAQSKLMKAQASREREHDSFSTWCKKAGEWYCEEDIPGYVKGLLYTQGTSATEVIRAFTGKLTPESIWSKDYAFYRGMFYFTAQGFDTAMAHFAIKGLIPEEEYDKWSKGWKEKHGTT